MVVVWSQKCLRHCRRHTRSFVVGVHAHQESVYPILVPNSCTEFVDVLDHKRRVNAHVHDEGTLYDTFPVDVRVDALGRLWLRSRGLHSADDISAENFPLIRRRINI
jgi:hypothetical protein